MDGYSGDDCITAARPAQGLSVFPQGYPHWHAVCGKTHVQIGVEVVDGLDESDAPHLEQIVGVLPPIGKFLDHRQHQPQVAGNELLPGLHVPRLGPAQQLHGLLIFQHLQLGRVDAADLHLSLHGSPSLFCVCTQYVPGGSFHTGATGGIFFIVGPLSMDFDPSCTLT